jgi:hypothetical protein
MCVFEDAERDQLWRVTAMSGRASCVPLRLGVFGQGNHLHGRRGRGFDAARWDGLRQSALCQGMQRQCRLGRGNHHRAGTEADQRGRGGIKPGEVVCGESVCGKACCVLEKPHPCRHGSRSTREVWVELWHVQSGCGVLCPVASRRVSAFNQARAGTVPDQRRRLGMHHGMVRRVDVGSGKSLPG